MLTVAHLEAGDVPEIVASFSAIGWMRSDEQYRDYLAQDKDGKRMVLIARANGIFAGYVTLLWTSKYPPFRDAGVPEVQDLNVLPNFRRQGVASELLDIAETRAGERASEIGIAVGLSADYGPAQRLYVRRGYLPDGRGACSHGKPLRWGQTARVDDDLVLFLTRQLGGKAI